MIQPRDYQSDALDAIEAGLHHHGRTLAVMATGLGKTTVFAELVRRWPGRSLVIAHREELIEQAAGRIGLVTGEAPGVEMAEFRTDERPGLRGVPKCVVSSVQTMSRPGRMARFDPAAFSLLVIDEAHHATRSNKTYSAVIDRFSNCSVLGVTATPKRGDGVKLGPVFQHVACDLSISWAVQNGWLVPVHQRVVKVDGLDFSKIDTTAGDWSAADLDRVLSEEGPLHAVARPTLELIGTGQCLVFCAGVNQAEALSGVFNRYRRDCSAWVCGDPKRTDPAARRAAVKDFKAGRLQILVNVGCFTEGFDAPATAFVVMARPTKSLALYVQMLGRATRTLDGVVAGLATAEERRAAIAASGKPHCTVLDFVGSTNELDPRQMTAADVLADGSGDAVRQRTRYLLADTPGGGDVREAAELAQEMLIAEELLMAEERARRARIKADAARYRVEDSGTIGVGDAQKLPPMHEPASKAQRGKLFGLGIPYERMSQRMTKRQASGWINRLIAEREGVPA